LDEENDTHNDVEDTQSLQPCFHSFGDWLIGHGEPLSSTSRPAMMLDSPSIVTPESLLHNGAAGQRFTRRNTLIIRAILLTSCIRSWAAEELSAMAQQAQIAESSWWFCFSRRSIEKSKEFMLNAACFMEARTYQIIGAGESSLQPVRVR
jgi:hypothetical protein